MWRWSPAAALLLAAVGLPGAIEAAPTSISACGTLSAPGAYVLANDLTASGDCLIVAADFVTIDLAGFKISGNGTGTGITDNLHTRVGIAVRGGTVENFAAGILLLKTTGAVVEQMRLFGNSGIAIFMGKDSVFRWNVVSGNGPGISDPVISIFENSLVAHNVVSDSKGHGMVVFGRSTVTGNTVSNNTISMNGSPGLSVNCPSNVVSNTGLGNLGLNLDLFGPGCQTIDNLAP
jgi:hypothetical protein